MSKVSVKSAARAAATADAKLRAKGSPALGAATLDSFQNFAFKLGVGADNALSAASYGFNPISRNRTILEWIYRGSWLGGVAVELVADDMTRAGVEFNTELPPDQSEAMEFDATRLSVWPQLNEALRWGRLYGGSLAIALIDGQDLRTPLRIETVGVNQFKGLVVLDRWMVEPALEDLVTEFGPHLGLPKYYRVQQNAPVLRGAVVHHSRVMVRHVGIQLPYQQQLMENMWGISVLERLYDRMVAFDSATTGAAQLVYKAYLRTLSVKGLREIVAAGGQVANGLTAYVDLMRRMQSIEGITVIDGDDKFEAQSHQAFSGLSDALIQFGQQLAGALQIPLVRLFGMSPSGFNSTGESDMRLYYDHVKQQQVKTLYDGVVKVYKLIAQSRGIKLPPNFSLSFRPLWELTDADKASIAQTISGSVGSMQENGIIGRQTALKELRQSSRTTGVFTNITQEMIEAADDEVGPPPGAEGPPGGPGMPPEAGDEPSGGSSPLPGTVTEPEQPKQRELKPNEPGSQGQAGAVAQSPRRRVELQQ